MTLSVAKPDFSIEQTTVTTTAQQSQDQDCFRIKVENKEVLYSTQHRNLLECLEDASVEVHYHCRDGYCGACRVTLSQGQVNYPQGEPLAYVASNEILPCCCAPTSNISIEVE